MMLIKAYGPRCADINVIFEFQDLMKFSEE